MKQLKEVFPELLTEGGFFTRMQFLPWYNSHVYPTIPSSLRLDQMLFLNHGDKIVSPMVNKLLDDNERMSDENMDILASMFQEKTYIELDHIWKAMVAEYDPVDNYNAHEEETHETLTDSLTLEKQGKETLEHSFDNFVTTDELDHDTTFERNETGTETETLSKQMGHTENRVVTPNLSETHGGTTRTAASGTDTNTEVLTGGNTQTNDIYAFNSVENSVPANKSVLNYNNQQTQTTIQNGRIDTITHGQTITQSGTQSDNLTYGGTDTDTNTHEFNNRKTTDSTTGTDTHTITKNGVETQETGYTGRKDITTHEYSDKRVLDRSGNIGVTTSAQMIKGEIELWIYSFFDDVVKRAAQFLCLSVYE